MNAKNLVAKWRKDAREKSLHAMDLKQRIDVLLQLASELNSCADELEAEMKDEPQE